MPAYRLIARANGLSLPLLAGAVALLALSACSSTVTDATPRLLSPQELQSEIAGAQTSAPAPAAALENRAAALRGRAAALRATPPATPADDDLRRRARELTVVAP